MVVIFCYYRCFIFTTDGIEQNFISVPSLLLTKDALIGGKFGHIAISVGGSMDNYLRISNNKDARMFWTSAVTRKREVPVRTVQELENRRYGDILKKQNEVKLPLL
ncbi:PREDICTED: uncharacterized protein LOC108363322 isoform X2 [Rhagoletis zephyria]|uniref:uncharacterized protein LOC118745828 n=1 Tax=Rhagoletis pomonella TaxID=28610 RepID=UPI0008112AC8|nr:PREDICTED: uncharacterized protein LOC108363322 isoform X2 [Rhagoletis zephyria]XP_036335391.1 uncharacterized protein LOC118745828 [Rhagoletis pomonella]